jgi:hypothetical protein
MELGTAASRQLPRRLLREPMLVSSSVARPTPKEMSMLESHLRGERSQPSSVTGELLTLRNILITTDFSECSARVLDHALESRVGTKRDRTCFIALMTIYNLVGPDAVQMACDAAWRDIQQLNADLRSKGLAKNVELKLLVEDGRPCDDFTRNCPAPRSSSNRGRYARANRLEEAGPRIGCRDNCTSSFLSGIHVGPS